MAKDVIIPLDFPSQEHTLDFLAKFKGHDPYVKIGMELFYSAGPDIVRRVKDMGYRVFLDLKLHDIPNTVKGGMASIARLNVDMTNLHAAGSIAMMEAAMEGLASAGSKRPLLLAVTQLTSTSEQTMQSELLISVSLEQAVITYAQNAMKAGLDGVVCSPLEARLIKENCRTNFLTVTPGVRPLGADIGDQSRVTTPKMARELLSDYIVVGRPITKAPDPLLAWQQIKADFLGE